jgi:hypothetical protein
MSRSLWEPFTVIGFAIDLYVVREAIEIRNGIEHYSGSYR